MGVAIEAGGRGKGGVGWHARGAVAGPGAWTAAICQSPACALTSREAIRRRRSRGGACRRTKAGGAAVGRGAHHGDRRRLRHQEHHRPGRPGRSDRCGRPALGCPRSRAEPSQPNRSPPCRCAARSKTSTSCVWSAASSREPFGAISTSRTSSRRRPTASSSGSSPTIPWPHPATPGSVPRWPGASAWGSAFRRHHDAGSRAAAVILRRAGESRGSLATRIADGLHVRS